MYRYVLLLLLLLPTFVHGQDAKDKPMGEVYGMGYKPLTPERRRELHAESTARHGGRLAMLAKFQALPSSFDCRDKGWVLPVGDQGNCGSCYLYSTIYGTLTQTFVRAGYGKADGSFVMSVQYGMDCHDFGGCNGGNGTEVIDWACKNGWYAEKWVDLNGVSHADYPTYSASSRACRKVPGAKEWKPASWGFVAASPNRPATTLEIKTALVNYGPLNVALDAGGQFGNGTGTITSLGNSIDHEIELVAYDDAKDGGAFLLKNQWAKSWGVGGYRWVTYSAAQRLVDVFFVTASVLPPPPPIPPDPPGPSPTPNNGDTITLNIGGKQTVYQIVPSGSKIITPEQERVIREILDPIPPIKNVPSTKEEPPTLKKVSQAEPTGDYDIARDGAERNKQDLVIFCRMPTRFDVSGAIIVRDDGYCLVPGVYVAMHDGKRLSETHYRFPTDVAGSDVRAWMQARREVSRPTADPFRVVASPIICRT